MGGQGRRNAVIAENIFGEIFLGLALRSMLFVLDINILLSVSYWGFLNTVFQICQPMVIGTDSTPTRIRKFGCGDTARQ